MKKQSVLAIGDSFLDHGVVEFPATVDPRMSESMYRLGKPIRPECELVTMTGGVWAVADYLRAITNDNVVVHCVPGEVPTTSWTDPSQIPARNFVDYRLSDGSMRWSKEAKRWLPDGKKTYRIKRTAGTQRASDVFLDAAETLLGTDKVLEQSRIADLLYICDRHHGFRRRLSERGSLREKLLKVLRQYRGEVNSQMRPVIVEVTDPLDDQNLKLVEALRESDMIGDSVFVLSSNSIRMSDTEQKDDLSLENSVQSFCEEIQKQAKQKESLVYRVKGALAVVVRLGIRAALVWLPDGSSLLPVSYATSPINQSICLVYPVDAYDHMVGAGIESSDLGTMYGYTSLIGSELARECLRTGMKAPLDTMKTGLARGLMRCRSHFEMGLGAEAVFLRDRRSNLCPPSVDQVARDDSRANEQFWVISPPRSIDELGKWTILESNAPGLRLDGRTAPNSPLPYEIIRKGFGILKDYGIPVARHVDLQTADRQEIERYSAISTLASKYIETDTWKRPLCLAVFGPPGCGKSFGIGQVANAITALKPDSRLTPMPFNLSQMRSVDALAKAFHQVRNRGLAGDMPLVLLDEFDSSHDGEEFGWLKFLLAPMQDGQFLDGDEVLHLPRCIIVCIGGQNRDFKELESRLRHKGFLDAKGRDFVSRLRNNLEIKGPDAYYREYSEEYASEKEAKGKEAKAFIGRKVRRAMLLRSTIETRLQVILQEVVENERLIKLANIDESVIRGFLDIPEYKHGVRSLEAIVEMSRALVTRRCFLKSSLPPEEQLDMHVDARDFLRYVRGTDQK